VNWGERGVDVEKMRGKGSRRRGGGGRGEDGRDEYCEGDIELVYDRLAGVWCWEGARYNLISSVSGDR